MEFEYVSHRGDGAGSVAGWEVTLPPAIGLPWTSPLREIERSAQEAAKQQALDMGEPGARERLRSVLEDQVARWRREYRKGTRPLDIADPEAAVERALRNLTGYGPLEPLLEDPDVWEIMIAG